MASDLTRISVSTQHASVEFDLLQVVLAEDVYPWSASDVNEIAELATMETNWADQLSDEEHDAIAVHSQQFFNQLGKAWVAADLTALQSVLLAKFQDRVPAKLIHQLSHKAQELVNQPLALVDQLVHCIQDVFPGWGQDDLQVLARPYAFAMRSPDKDKLEIAAQSVRSVAWAELSEIEQARLSLAIAHYTLSQLPPQSSAT